MVPALSSSNMFNSKQWQMQQHDLLLTQQRKQLEQLKKEQEELKTRLRHYGKVSTQSAQVSPKHATVTQAAPNQPKATLSTPDNGSVEIKQSNVLSELVDNSKPDMSSTIPDLDAKSTKNPRNVLSDSNSSDEITEHKVPCSHSSGQLNYDERPIKPLQGGPVWCIT